MSSVSLSTGTAVKTEAPLPVGLDNSYWRYLSYANEPEPLPTGMDKFYSDCIGWFASLKPRQTLYLREAAVIMKDEAVYMQWTERQLREALQPYVEAARRCRLEGVLRQQAVAILREISFRSLGKRPYLVQVAGCLALHDGLVVQMATGEGKSLTCALAATLMGWGGRGCHVMTTNNYLACRDAEELEPLFHFCGVTVAGIADDDQGEKRAAAYRADITYCTNKDVAADFLRDKMMLGAKSNLNSHLLGAVDSDLNTHVAGLTLRGLECVIVDEADSVLIDDGCVPLIISSDGGEGIPAQELYNFARTVAEALPPETYEISRKNRSVELLPAACKRIEELTAKQPGPWKSKRRREELISMALEAKFFFKRDEQYVLMDGKVVIVDESTGRLQPDRFWRAGVHQSVECKEGVEVSADKETCARISFQKFFRLYRKLSGISGTITETRSEIWSTYHRCIVAIPTHKPCIRKFEGTQVFADEAGKLAAIAAAVMEATSKGRPVLVGTASIRESEIVGKLLEERGVKHEILNALRHKEEAEIVGRAGLFGAVTIATNMAGRGTDIKLGKGVRELGGLLVLASGLFANQRIDRQLYGRCSRQGDPGSVKVYLSLDDELPKAHAGLLRLAAKPLARVLPKGPWLKPVFSHAQTRLGRSQRAQRDQVLQSDQWLESMLGFTGGGGA